MPAFVLGERRRHLGADRSGNRATGAEPAAGRRVDRARRLALELEVLPPALDGDVGHRHRRDQVARVGVERALEEHA